MRKPIKNYEGLYECDDKGNIYSLITNKMLKPFSRKDRPLYMVSLCKDKKIKRTPIHKIVYEAFNGETKGGFILHKDKNNLNNRIDNLEYVETLKGMDKTYRKKVKQDRDYNTKPLDGEVWVDLIGFADKYKISNFGRIIRKKGKGCNKEFIISQYLKETGYYSAKINCKTSCVHKMEYESFYGKIKEGNEIDHIDSDSTNNKLSNLREVTPEENKSNNNTLEKIEKNRLHTGYIRIDDNGEELARYYSLDEAAEKENVNKFMIKKGGLKRKKIFFKKFKYYK